MPTFRQKRDIIRIAAKDIRVTLEPIIHAYHKGTKKVVLDMQKLAHLNKQYMKLIDAIEESK